MDDNEADEHAEVEQQAPAELTPMQIVERGLHRLAYKQALSGLIGATQQWANAARAVIAAEKKADPDGTFSDEETDAAGVCVQETFRAVVEQSPGLRSLFAVVAGLFDASIPE